MIRKCTKSDFDAILDVINNSAEAYSGIIPDDRYKIPYFSDDYLRREIDEGIEFWGFERDGSLAGVMGIQDILDVTLIRHAYVRTDYRNRGIGSSLLKFLLKRTDKPVLIGTWAGASWAVSFYKKHGFRQVAESEKDYLLGKYWKLPEGQVETSVVLVDERY